MFRSRSLKLVAGGNLLRQPQEANRSGIVASDGIFRVRLEGVWFDRLVASWLSREYDPPCGHNKQILILMGEGDNN